MSYQSLRVECELIPILRSVNELSILSVECELIPILTHLWPTNFLEFFDESSYRVAIGLAKFQDSTSVIFIHYQDIEFIIFWVF